MANGDWKQKVSEARRRAVEWMRGRRGADDIVYACIYLAFILGVINIFAHWAWMSWLALALLVYGLFRIQSKNLAARSRENESFLKAIGPLRPWLQNPKAAATEAKQFKHVKCSHCGQKVRVPRGKGRLRVTCPKCREKFEVKS
ncbi:zinc ribbon domain-containing protein [Paratractidigestivibacter sp.]|uniref:zinc ribbon domain-containing protein n=1 Tax=Paratractidigestivibacter sp. TaxID=2847316 RepID=UPI002AC8E710|nr:zinc ribbon domain-containing protein [Paratractidigestivibacter sp.]